MNGGSEVKKIGSKIRQARKARRLRLKDVAKRVGCSESLLSKLEHDRVTPSLNMLHRIVTALDTSIGALFTDPSHGDVQIYRKNNRPVIIIDANDCGKPIRLERLVPHSEDTMIDGNIHIIEHGAWNGGEIKHKGQEVGYVIEGELTLAVGEKTYVLTAGDSFFFRSDLPHSYRNLSNTVTRVIWINTPPTF